MQSVPKQRLPHTIHTIAKVLLKLHISPLLFNNHYDVIISLTDDVFTLGPFRESFMSLRNIDKFWVNLKQNPLKMERHKKTNDLTYRDFLLINSFRYHPWGYQTTAPWPPVCPAVDSELYFASFDWNNPRLTESDPTAASTSTTDSCSLRTWSHSTRCSRSAGVSPDAPPALLGTCRLSAPYPLLVSYQDTLQQRLFRKRPRSQNKTLPFWVNCLNKYVTMWSKVAQHPVHTMVSAKEQTTRISCCTTQQNYCISTVLTYVQSETRSAHYQLQNYCTSTWSSTTTKLCREMTLWCVPELYRPV